MTRVSRERIVGGLLTAVVVVAVVIGMVVIGSPARERMRRLDERRVQDLTGIARAIDLYWTRHARLPSSLEELEREPGGNISSNDPGTHVPYEYRPLPAGTYELCARFESAPAQENQARSPGFWSHGGGRQCFQRTARKID